MSNYIEAVKNLLSVTLSIGLLWIEALQWAVIIHTKKRNGAYSTMADYCFCDFEESSHILGQHIVLGFARMIWGTIFVCLG